MQPLILCSGLERCPGVHAFCLQPCESQNSAAASRSPTGVKSCTKITKNISRQGTPTQQESMFSMQELSSQARYARETLEFDIYRCPLPASPDVTNTWHQLLACAGSGPVKLAVCTTLPQGQDELCHTLQLALPTST